MERAYAWFAFGAFSLCMVGMVASYLWDEDYLWWPLLFAVIAVAVMVPVVVLPWLRVFVDAFRENPDGPGTD